MRGEYNGWFQRRKGILNTTPQRIFSNVANPGPLTGTGSTQHWEVNPTPTVIARVTDGTTVVFSVDINGNVTAKSVVIDQKDTTTTALVVKSAGPTYSANLSEWKDSAGVIRTVVGSTGKLFSILEMGARQFLDTFNRVAFDPTIYGLIFGSGTATQDVNLYRYAADILATDDDFIVGGDLTVSGDLSVEGGTVTVQDEGVEVDTVSTLNFQGGLVRATVDDDGVANIRVETDLDAMQLQAELAFDAGLTDIGGMDSWLT